MRLDGVVPFTMKGLSEQIDGSQFFVGDFETGGIGLTIFERCHRQAFLRGCMRDEFKDDFQGCERFRAPIDRNEGKEAMFNLVPFAGRRRIMRLTNFLVARYRGMITKTILPLGYVLVGVCSISLVSLFAPAQPLHLPEVRWQGLPK